MLRSWLEHSRSCPHLAGKAEGQTDRNSDATGKTVESTIETSAVVKMRPDAPNEAEDHKSPRKPRNDEQRGGGGCCPWGATSWLVGQELKESKGDCHHEQREGNDVRARFQESPSRHHDTSVPSMA